MRIRGGDFVLLSCRFRFCHSAFWLMSACVYIVIGLLYVCVVCEMYGDHIE